EDLGEKIHPIYVHPKALVTTKFHIDKNRELEKELNHGSCGMGIGVTRQYHSIHGESALFAKDLLNYHLTKEKLENIKGSLCPDSLIPTWDIAHRLCTSFERCFQVEEEKDINWGDNTVIFEGAQGILLDQTYGFHPHTTWSDTTARHAI